MKHNNVNTMKAVIQRVKTAKVTINKETTSQIKQGLLVLLGIEKIDTERDIHYLTNKIANLRIFNDNNGIMNLSVQDISGEILVVSQFTLHASTKKGNRPSFIEAAKPEISKPLYQKFITHLEKIIEKPVKTGIFGANMEVSLINDGPVTIIIDSQNLS